MSIAVSQIARLASNAQRHATAEEYRAFLRGLPRGESYKRELMQYRAQFVAAYPNLAQWKMAPLTERVGLTTVAPAERMTNTHLCDHGCVWCSCASRAR